MKRVVCFFILIVVLLLSACAKEEGTGVETIEETQDVSTFADTVGDDKKVPEQVLDNSWVGYYTRSAESVDDGRIIIEFFIYQEDDRYYGYLNMDGFENDGDWAYTYPQGRMLMELREEHGEIGAYFVEDFSEIKQEEYFGNYRKDDLLFYLKLEEDNLYITREKLAIREKEENKEKRLVGEENCIEIILVNQRDREIYLKARRILEDEAPFYRYEDDDHVLEVYYDEQRETGIGLSYQKNQDEAYIVAFDITECERKEWQDNRFALTKDGTDTSVLENYEENCEYNENGQLTKFESKGILKDSEGAEDTIVSIEFFYREDGTLERKECYYNQWLFGTTRSTELLYYDSQERLIYTWAYITHGCLEDYYIYNGDSMEPAYCLTVDHFGTGACMLDFAKYETDQDE